MEWSMLRLLCLALLGSLSQCFYIYLTNGSAQCFYNNIFSDEQLLVEVETPIISVANRIVLRVTANSQLILQKDIINLVKITVPKASVAINDKSPDSQLEYETCFAVEDYETVDIEANDSIQQVDPGSIVVPKGYLLSVKLMNNFSHKLENHLEVLNKANINYREIEKLSDRLLTLNSEQVSLHQINEAKEKLTQTYLQQLKGKVIIFSILEILMILLFMMVQVRLLRGYIDDVSIV